MTQPDLLEVDDLTPTELTRVLETAAKWKADPTGIPQVLGGQGAALLFEKPSARTRVSTEMAVATLGGHPIYIRGEEVGLDSRETVEDVARTLAGYCAVIAARVFDHRTLERMAAVVSVPVVNLLSDVAHPCQAIADVLTMREEFGSVEGRRLVFVGDGNNVAASLAFAAALAGFELVVASPPGFQLDEIVVARARNLGAQLELTSDPHEAVRGADAVYTDVWTSMGQEAEREERLRKFAGFQVDERLLALAPPHTRLMHCLPAHRGEEITGEVLDGERSIVFQQAGNRLHAQKALLQRLLS